MTRPTRLSDKTPADLIASLPNLTAAEAQVVAELDPYLHPNMTDPQSRMIRIPITTLAAICAKTAGVPVDKVVQAIDSLLELHAQAAKERH
jgi:hypothetical protein